MTNRSSTERQANGESLNFGSKPSQENRKQIASNAWIMRKLTTKLINPLLGSQNQFVKTLKLSRPPSEIVLRAQYDRNCVQSYHFLLYLLNWIRYVEHVLKQRSYS